MGTVFLMGCLVNLNFFREKGESYCNKSYGKQDESIKSQGSGTYAFIDERQVSFKYIVYTVFHIAL